MTQAGGGGLQAGVRLCILTGVTVLVQRRIAKGGLVMKNVREGFVVQGMWNDPNSNWFDMQEIELHQTKESEAAG